MTKSLFLLFNHRLTSEQAADARVSLQINRIAALPPELQRLWSQIPAHPPEIHAYLRPLRAWLRAQYQPEDYVLIQGDFGASFLMVNFAFEIRLIPVYATTVREAVENFKADGAIEMKHRFRHVTFRKYGR